MIETYHQMDYDSALPPPPSTTRNTSRAPQVCYAADTTGVTGFDRMSPWLVLQVEVPAGLVKSRKNKTSGLSRVRPRRLNSGKRAVAPVTLTLRTAASYSGLTYR